MHEESGINRLKKSIPVPGLVQNLETKQRHFRLNNYQIEGGMLYFLGVLYMSMHLHMSTYRIIVDLLLANVRFLTHLRVHFVQSFLRILIAFEAFPTLHL